MNISGASQFVSLWLLANAMAALVLAVGSYFLAKWSLDALDAFDRWLSRQEQHRGPKS